MKIDIKNFNIYLSIIIAAVSSLGLLFGFYTGVLTEALPFVKNCWFGLSINQRGWVTLITIFGAIVGSVIAGYVGNKYGRKNLLILNIIIYALASVLSGASAGLVFFMSSRGLMGVGMGISSLAVPLYLAEISPAKHRGAIVLAFPTMIAVGILLSYLLNMAMVNEINPFSWRSMFLVAVFISILLFVFLLFIPETPGFLFSLGKYEEGKAVLKKLSVSSYSDSLAKIVNYYKNEERLWHVIFKSAIRLPAFIVIALMLIQQLVGFIAVLAYAPKLFLYAGLNSQFASSSAIIILGLVNFIASIFTIIFIDKIGRRSLYFVGLGGLGLSLVTLGSLLLIASLNYLAKKFIAISLVSYFWFFAISIGPIGWLLIAELFAFKYKMWGMTLGIIAYWVFNALALLTYSKLASLFNFNEIHSNTGNLLYPNPAGLFFFYSFFALAGIVWGIKYMPETSKIELEDIEEHLRKEKKNYE